MEALCKGPPSVIFASMPTALLFTSECLAFFRAVSALHNPDLGCCSLIQLHADHELSA